MSPRFDWIALARPEPAAGRRLSMAHRELPAGLGPVRVMTRAIESALRAYGYIDEQIAQLTPHHQLRRYCPAATGLPVPNTMTFAPIGVRL